MAHPARLPNKRTAWRVAALLLAAACTAKQPSQLHLRINMSSPNVAQQNGLYFYNKQPFTGCLFALQQNGRDTAFSGYFTEGKENGLQRKWYPNGRLCEERMFDHGLKTGVHKGFWENGKPRFRYHFVKDMYEGTQYKYFWDGKLYTKKNYKNGQEAGMQQEWSQQGQLVINYQSVNGRQYGNIGKKNCASIWVDSVYAKPRP